MVRLTAALCQKTLQTSWQAAPAAPGQFSENPRAQNSPKTGALAPVPPAGGSGNRPFFFGPFPVQVCSETRLFPDSPEFSGSPRHSESRHLYAR
jgi:hypothetical protein